MGRCNIQMSILPKLTYRLNTIPVKILLDVSGHFVVRIAKMVLKHMNNVVRILPPNFMTQHEATGIEMVWNCGRSLIDQWNIRES